MFGVWRWCGQAGRSKREGVVRWVEKRKQRGGGIKATA